MKPIYPDDEPQNRVAMANYDASFERGHLAIWTIFDHPKDYPEGFIARMFEVGEGPTDQSVTGDLAFIRQVFEDVGLTCIPRDPNDEPQIVESWL
jgi:hypothetical protein